jgi:type IV secretion system protein VirD4
LVNILAKKGESMIITDLKQKYNENNAIYLRARGYNIIILNFRNPQKGNN